MVISQDGELAVTVTGDKVNNYTLPTGYVSGTEKDNITWTVNQEDGVTTSIVMKRDGLVAGIKPVALSYTALISPKVYDGTANVAFNLAALGGLASADKEHIDSLSVVFTDKNAASGKTVTPVSAADKIVLTNYTLPQISLSITPRPLSITGLTAKDKVYDGTTDAVIGGMPVIDPQNKIAGDDVAVDADAEVSGRFYDANVGHHKSVIGVAGSGLTGADAGNYYADPAKPLQANITAVELTVTPDAGQYKSGGALDPKFTYTLTGLAESDEKPALRGILRREAGETAGEYAYTLGSLVAGGNYTLRIRADTPKFEIRNTDAMLATLTVSTGKLSPVFSTEVARYTVKLPHGATAVPAIEATTKDEDASMLITSAADLSGSTTVVVTAADGVSVKTYTIGFAVDGPVLLSPAWQCKRMGFRRQMRPRLRRWMRFAIC